MNRKNRHPLYGMALYSAILAQLAGSTLVGVFAGNWLDNITGKEPLFLVVGLFFGLAAGVMALIYTIRQFFSED
ncbi:F0F1-type ATP synthase assembly protein I [Bacillus thermophilus]|uniref:F0F1-type ATP synthase assembly protein I n=1 Tax=Siminovitchia thermophila TaxID=1245522 RepID=A0ABS2R4C4_9BACI|nr:AtpZ/AtpI family protein [Siminovitchia thermophila]MBM7714491.1 F0F1-type ATP synthase assembly protein I [Siminovitchia thermophila]ONK24978.1 hypothetical protein BLX87_02035 [Bacillus sp. VT-16-64]